MICTHLHVFFLGFVFLYVCFFFHCSYYFFYIAFCFSVRHCGETECGIIQDYLNGLPLYKV